METVEERLHAVEVKIENMGKMLAGLIGAFVVLGKHSVNADTFRSTLLMSIEDSEEMEGIREGVIRMIADQL